MMAYGDIKLFAGSGCPKLAQRIAEYVKIPLSSWDIIEFPNENLFVKLHGSVRGQDVYLIQTHDRPVHATSWRCSSPSTASSATRPGG
jgi:ribose-phosphate pyrophosphokinase